MSARARFVPGSAPPRQQPASSTPASSEPASVFPARSQPDDGDSITRSASRAGDHDSSRPLNTSSLKKLTSKKSAGRAPDLRAAAVATDERVPDSSLGSTIASPDPRHPSALMGPPDFSMFRPPSPRPRAAAMLPPPAPPSAYNQARPKSRAAHVQAQQHVSLFDQPSASHHSEQYSVPQPTPIHPQARDFAQPNQNAHPSQRGSGQHLRTSTMPTDHRNVSRPPDPHYRDSPGRRSMSVESNAGTNKRFADEHEVDSADHPAKRPRVDDVLQNEMHYAGSRRGTSPLSDLEPMHDGINPGTSAQNRSHYFQQRDDMPTAPTAVHPLQQLMGGFDLAAFAGAHVKQYEMDYAKWEASSHEEWEAYGSVLIERFSKCIDMVKEYTRHKVQLHASLQGITEKHRGVLRKRDKAIEGITAGLAKQTTQALSRNSGLD